MVKKKKKNSISGTEERGTARAYIHKVQVRLERVGNATAAARDFLHICPFTSGGS
jgi:hypothetical protein